MILLGEIDQLIESDVGAARRIGIMGGSFDPIHIGHLYCAEQARQACDLDAVVFIPAGKPHFKADRRLAPISERIEMCRLATRSNPDFFVSDIEAGSDRLTYSSDTMRRLREAYPDAVRFEFIVGTDSLLTLRSWHEAGSLAPLCGFICVCRPAPSAGAKSEAMRTEIALLEEMGFEITCVEAPMLDISSSEIRERIYRGGSIRYIVPSAVRDYIYAHDLYASPTLMAASLG